MKLQFNNLMLEITRECNMKCKHCMRGKSENLCMEWDVIEEIFKNTTQIGHLVLTGGEPSLAPQNIERIIRSARRYNCGIGNFYCATNAKEYSDEFCKALKKLHRYCTEPQKCALSITADQFHEPYSPEAAEQYRALPFYNPVAEKGEIPKTAIINRGNAKTNGIGFFDMDVPEYIFDVTKGYSTLTVGDRLYINALGDVLLDADLSYKEQKKHRIGNVLESDMENILTGRLYSPLDQPAGHICKMTVVAEEGTIGNEETVDERYYKRFSKALAAFSNFVFNLQMTPTAEPAEVILKVQTDYNKNYMDNNQWPAQSVMQYYTVSGQYIGDVTVTMDFVRLEDEDG